MDVIKNTDIVFLRQVPNEIIIATIFVYKFYPLYMYLKVHMYTRHIDINFFINQENHNENKQSLFGNKSTFYISTYLHMSIFEMASNSININVLFIKNSQSKFPLKFPLSIKKKWEFWGILFKKW